MMHIHTQAESLRGEGRNANGSIFLSRGDTRELDNPRSTWNRLAVQAEQQDPFYCSSTWQLSYHETLNPGRPTIINHCYDCMLSGMAKSASAWVIFARHEEQDIGFIFGVFHVTFYRSQQFSFDNAWGTYSIGNVLQSEQVKQLCEEGVKRSDMVPLPGSSMGCKHHWGEIKLPMESWTLSWKRSGRLIGGNRYAG